MDLRTFRARAGGEMPAPGDTSMGGAAPGGAHMMTVSELTGHISALFSGSHVLSHVVVHGELSGTKPAASGHLYFSLKDENSLIRAVMFRSAAARLRFAPSDGMKVMVEGSVTVYAAGGQYQIIVSAMEPDGLGALYLAYEQLRRKLQAEGLFDEGRKRPLPPYPMRIGVITSPTGAAVRDILNILGRRFPCASVLLYPALVQGSDAPRDLCRALAYFNRHCAADVLIIGRGGGSPEDLFAFNNEELVRAVAASDIPVISAVGHETDFTLCDFAADRRAPTPSAAAELAVPDTGALLGRLRGMRERMDTALSARISTLRRTLKLLSERPVLSGPTYVLGEKRLRVDALAERMERSVRILTERKGQAVRVAAGKLHALSPLSVLGRGYCAAFSEDGAVLTAAEKLTVGEPVRLRFSDGTADATVDRIEITAGQTGADTEEQHEKE